MVKQIRILHYIGSLEMGGSQTLIMEIYRNLNRQKIQFDFIVDKKDKLIYGKEKSRRENSERQKSTRKTPDRALPYDR